MPSNIGIPDFEDFQTLQDENTIEDDFKKTQSNTGHKIKAPAKLHSKKYIIVSHRPSGNNHIAEDTQLMTEPTSKKNTDMKRRDEPTTKCYPSI